MVYGEKPVRSSNVQPNRQFHKIHQRERGNHIHKHQKRKKIGNDKDTSVVVEIKDTGPGIDPEIFPKLFTKFTTKSFQGTGLGLYICKNIIGSWWANMGREQQH